jgi:hypothetical protein
MKEFLAEYARGWGKDGYLTRIGLITSPDETLAAANAQVTGLKPLAAAELK